MRSSAITGIRRWGAVACAVLAGLAVAGPSQARRLALVIGNGQYVNTDPLTNPERDVEAISARFRALGFEVAESKDVAGDSLRSQITSFKRAVSDNDTVVIYYAGHGMEVAGHDYLLPVNADIQNVGDVADWGYPLDGLFFTDKHNVGVIVIFDACRDNTFLRRTRSNTAGTSVINVPPGDMVIFSASAGEVALDGDPGQAQSASSDQNSVFANALLGALAAPNFDDRDLFVEVRRQVQAHSNQQQNPQIIGALNAKFVFNAQSSPGQPSVQYAASSPPPAAPAEPAPAPVEMAAATQAPGASVYRSIPSPSESPRPAVEPVVSGVGAAPPASVAAPPPPAIPAAAAPAPVPAPAPAVAAPVAQPPALASVAAPPVPAAAVAAPAAPSPPAASVTAASAPTVVVPAAPPAEPMQVASLTRAPPLAAAGYGPLAIETATPRLPGVYTIASLGENRLPPRPDLTPVPPINLPARFCSAEERNSFHDGTYKPAWQIASINNQLTIRYLDALNALHREYTERQSGYANMITREYNDYAPIAAAAFDVSKTYTGLHDAIMAIPVATCK